MDIHLLKKDFYLSGILLFAIVLCVSSPTSVADESASGSWVVNTATLSYKIPERYRVDEISLPWKVTDMEPLSDDCRNMLRQLASMQFMDSSVLDGSICSCIAIADRLVGQSAELASTSSQPSELISRFILAAKLDKDTPNARSLAAIASCMDGFYVEEWMPRIILRATADHNEVAAELVSNDLDRYVDYILEIEGPGSELWLSIFPNVTLAESVTFGTAEVKRRLLSRLPVK